MRKIFIFNFLTSTKVGTTLVNVKMCGKIKKIKKIMMVVHSACLSEVFEFNKCNQ